MSEIIENIQGLAIAGGVLAVVGVGLYFWFKDPSKIPKEIIDKGDKLGKGLEEALNPLRDVTKKATGGFINPSFRTAGRLDTSQAETESKIKKDKTPGANIGITLATIALAPSGIAPAAAVLLGITNQAMLGKDKSIAREISKGKNEARDEQLKKQVDIIANALSTNDASKLDAIKIKDPLQYLSESEIKLIEDATDKLLDHGVWITPIKDNRSRYRKALIKFHQFKQVQLAGLYLEDIDKEAIQMNAETFVHSMQKILHPKAVIIVGAQRKRAVEDFLNKWNF